MALISVLLTVYNCDKYLKQAIDSILRQTWSDFEFIIVNDGSTDNSENILAECCDSRITVITCKENRGVAYARNIGLEQCKSEYIALMDADDIALTDRLQVEYDFLKEHKDIDGVYTKFQYMNQAGELMDGEFPKAYYNYKYVKAQMILRNIVANPTVMFRKQIVEKYHIHYDETWRIASDYKFWCDYLMYGKVIGIDKVLCYYRLRNHSLYNNASLSCKEETARKMMLYNFEKHGFRFSKDEKEILLKVFGINGRIDSGKEIVLLYEALSKMIEQAVQNGLEFADEIQIMCKKEFMQKIQQIQSLKNW